MSTYEPHPLDNVSEMSLDAVIAQLKYQRETHTDWADWFEKHPEDPRAVQQFGDAAFHRRVESNYTRMIDFLEGL